MNSIFSELQIRIVLGLMAAIEKRFPVKFPLNYTCKEEGLYLFGFDHSDPSKPWIELRITGDGPGDTYSGSITYDDTFRVKNLYVNTRRVSLDYNRTATNIAGDCSTLTSSYFEEDEWLKVENDFFEVLNGKGEVAVFKVFTT